MIPLSIPHLNGNEWKYVKDCLDTGWISSAGSYVTRFEEAVAAQSGRAHGVACVNGTAGLHIAQILCGVEPDDLVIAPDITFIATINAIKYTGADPILIDVDITTWQMDMDLLERFLVEETEQRDGVCMHYKSGRRVSAIMPVHVLGNIGDMSRLVNLATEHNLIIIEDTTEAQGSYYQNRPAGSMSTVGVFSYNGNKIISTGGGGVMVMDDPELARRAKHLTTQAKISPDEYIHDEIGYNYRLVNILAAVGLAQMEQLDDIILRKKHMNDYYRSELDGVGDIVFQKVREDVQPNNWLFTFRTVDMRSLLASLREHEIIARPFWMPMHQLEMFRDDIFYTEENISDQVYATSLSIPSSAGITDSQLARVVEVIKDFY